MKKSLLLLALLIVPAVLGAMDPSKPFCERQGYNILLVNASFYCVFSDGNKCPVWEFYQGTCGAEYKKDMEFPCRKEGELVFTEFEECCEGLEPYLPYMTFGQASCQPFSKRFVGNLKSNPLYWLAEAVILIFIIAVIIRMIKKKK